MNPSISPNQQYWRNCQNGIPAEVILGSPKSKECKNLGICRIHLERSRDCNRCGTRTVAYLRIDRPTGRLLVHFLVKSLSASCRNRFFANGEFRIVDNFSLSHPIAESLGLTADTHSFQIEQGCYVVLNDDHFYTVSLRLSAEELTLAIPQAA